MAGLDFVKLVEFKKQLDQEIHQEMMEDLTKDLIGFVLDEDLKQSFREEKSRKFTEQSKRVLSYWVKKGVLKPADRSKEGAWFQFDKIESIWIDIVTQIREFGLDLDKLLIIREALFTETVPNFRLIDFCLMHSILKEPYLMIVYPSGKISTISLELYSKTIATENLPPHLVFNFFYLAKDIFPNNNFNLALKDPKSADLSPAEMKILYYLRTGDFKDIKVRMQEGETYLLEVSRKIDTNDKIIEIIRNGKYQNIEIITENGKIVSINSTEKIK
ncbi:hypothetical protein, partial [Flavobacterium sp.]|uniref:hypothetical protein n=1 Tax=Flavobacterium sp. TaxID=239 RepID=UPI003751B16E